MSLRRSNAVVIGHYSLGETDKIVVFFTRDYGKVRAVAKGVKRLKSRLSGKTEMLNYGELIYFERAGKDLHLINSFDIIEPFQAIKEDLMKMAYCSYIADLIQHITSEANSDPDIFDLMLSALYLIKFADDIEIIIRAFELKLLEKMGLNPRLDLCVICSNKISDEFPKFSVQSGGVICEKCARSGHHAFNISSESLEIMRRMANIPLDIIPSLNMPNSNRQEIKKILLGFLSFHVDMKNLHSLSFLESIEKEKF